jgi:hypothetical protein
VQSDVTLESFRGRGHFERRREQHSHSTSGPRWSRKMALPDTDV